MRENDRIRARHIVEAADDIGHFIAGRVRADLESDRMLLYAVVRAVEIIGEAASRISEELRLSTPTIPWQAIVGMRNRIVHAYFDIDTEMVWATAREEVPTLRLQIMQLLEESEDA